MCYFYFLNGKVGRLVYSQLIRINQFCFNFSFLPFLFNNTINPVLNFKCVQIVDIFIFLVFVFIFIINICVFYALTLFFRSLAAWPVRPVCINKNTFIAATTTPATTTITPPKDNSPYRLPCRRRFCFFYLFYDVFFCAVVGIYSCCRRRCCCCFCCSYFKQTWDYNEVLVIHFVYSHHRFKKIVDCVFFSVVVVVFVLFCLIKRLEHDDDGWHISVMFLLVFVVDETFSFVWQWTSLEGRVSGAQRFNSFVRVFTTSAAA